VTGLPILVHLHTGINRPGSVGPRRNVRHIAAGNDGYITGQTAVLLGKSPVPASLLSLPEGRKLVTFAAPRVISRCLAGGADAPTPLLSIT